MSPTIRSSRQAALKAGLLALSLAASPLHAFAQSAAAPATQSTEDATTDPQGSSGGVQATAPSAPARPKIAQRAKASAHRGSAYTVEQRITELHNTLKITSAQQPVFDEFAAVMRANAQAMTASFQGRATQVASMNADQNMQSFAQMAQQHAQQLQTLSTSFSKLYASLSDEQKKRADDSFRAAMARHS